MPIVILAAFDLKNDFQVWVAATSPMKGAKDLAGAGIGITLLGGMAQAYGVAIVKGWGWKRE